MPALRAPNRGLRTAEPEPQTPNRARGLQPRAQNFV